LDNCNNSDNSKNDDSLPILTTNKYIENQAEKKTYNFIGFNEMTPTEKSVYSYENNILKLIGGRPYQVKDIKIQKQFTCPEYFR
jgi:hypothetical protein